MRADAPLAAVRDVAIETSRGPVAGQYYDVATAKGAALWVGGVGGGWDTPALGLYPQLCRDLQTHNVASLRVRFRRPTILGEAVHDLRAGFAFLRRQGIGRFAVTGHSLGGAVAIAAAAQEAGTRAVICLAPQSYGAQAVRSLPEDCAVLFVHGTADRILPPDCSRQLYNLTPGQRRLMLLDGADHNLDEVAGDVRDAVRAWILAGLDDRPQGRVGAPRWRFVATWVAGRQ